MARICTICSHKRRAQIEAAIVARQSYRHIASQFDVGYKAVENHEKHHMQPIMQQVVQEQRAETKLVLSSALERVQRDLALVDEALAESWKDSNKDFERLVKLLPESRQQNRLYAALTGELRQQDITQSPAWQEAVSLLFDALKAYPEAHQAVIHQIEAERAKRRRA